MALQLIAFVIRNALDWCDLSLPKYFCELTRFLNYSRLQLGGSFILQDESFEGDINCVVTFIQLAGKPKSDEVIICLHGGGFTLRDGGELIFGESVLSNWSKCTDGVPPVVCGIQYDLAAVGRSTFPTAIDQIIKVQEVLKSRGYKIIAISGDSAGGNLAIASLVKSHELVLSTTAPCCVAISPGCDMRMESDAFTFNKYKDYLSASWIDQSRRAYVCGKPILGADASDEEKKEWRFLLENPLISPICASDDQLARLPPMLVYGGNDELLIDDIRAFVKRFSGLDTIEFVEGGPGTMHNYPYIMAPGNDRVELYKHIVSFILKHSCEKMAAGL
jgi:acetyl esterase/lipase